MQAWLWEGSRVSRASLGSVVGVLSQEASHVTSGSLLGVDEANSG